MRSVDDPQRDAPAYKRPVDQLTARGRLADGIVLTRKVENSRAKPLGVFGSYLHEAVTTGEKDRLQA
jgi:hypothetical protein